MSTLYKLGEYEVDTRRRQLWRDGELVPLAQKPFEVLLILIGRSGDVVTKEELMQAIWPNAFVEESNLTQCIFLLRKAFTDKASGSRYIITLPAVGYQLGVIPGPIEAAASSAPIPDEPEPSGTESTVTLEAPAAPKPNRKRNILALATAPLVFLAMLAGWQVWRLLRPAPFHNFSIRRLTNSGDVQMTAISRSGKYLAYVSRNPQRGETLSVMELRSGNSHVIFDGSGTVFSDIALSPDDSYVYYRGQRSDDNGKVTSEYRLPLLGGEPTKVVNDIYGPVTFLDSGERICFWRGEGVSQFSILSADADSGKNEKVLAQGQRPFPITIRCSPDGERAAISYEVEGIAILDFKSGRKENFYESSTDREIYPDLAWKADGSGLVANAVTPFNFDASLFLLSYPGGSRTQITQDLNSYQNPTISADGSRIVARELVNNEQFQSFALPLLADNPEVISFPWSAFLGWRNDEELAGSTTAGGLKVKNLQTSQEIPIQTQHGVQFLQPSGCGSSGLVASGGRSADRNIAIWHMNADGSDVKQLSHGQEDILPVCTRDGKWVVYADNSHLKKAAIYRVSVDGGAPQKIGDGSVWFALSHSGDQVAWIESASQKQLLVLAESATGKQTKTLPIPPQLQAIRSLTFAPDDQHIFFIARGQTADSIYDLPLDGSPPSKRIEFRGAHLAAIQVSPGGKYLGAVTVKPVSDAVLLEDRTR
jgi:DNA-binding winged helix-turn-helix (wHTH) protein/Tol biopolymer transport system component